MSKIAKNLTDLIGNTPLLSLEKYFNARIFAKVEFLNPGGSIKDRIAKYMIEEAEKEGKLRPGMTIVEPTSGNTGIGISLVGIRKGYNVVIVMPENMSEERKKVIKALGAELILTPKEESIEGTLRQVERLQNQNKNVFVLNQFKNSNNPLIHYKTTAVEICNQLNEKVDIFVSGLGSGGTLAGVGKYLKEKYPSCVIAAVEPKNVSALLGHEPGLHKIEGIGDGFIPDILDPSIIDEVIEVTDKDAVAYARKMARVCGCLVGTSSGANMWAALKMAEKYGRDKNIVTILPDRAERYFSTSLL